MVNVNRRIQQVAIGILTVFALVTSSVVACTCSHHQAEVKQEVPACHQHAEMTEMGGDRRSSAKNSGDCLSADDDCFCSDGGKKIFSKFEALKLKKQVAAISLPDPIPATILETAATTGIAFAKPSYLSDSFYNLAPKRGPPRL